MRSTLVSRRRSTKAQRSVQAAKRDAGRCACLAMLCGLLSPLTAQSTSSCHAQTADALNLRSYIRELVSTTDTARVRLRNTLGLSKTDSTKVVLVTATATCVNVATGINTGYQTPNLARHLYVVQVGKLFAAQDPDHLAGEYAPTVILDAKFRALNAVLAP